jgi:tRNA(Ile)-lysidine synthetase-like protein
MNEYVKKAAGFLEKITWPTPGKYIIAVSGGVDSVVLLHLLKYFAVVASKEQARQSFDGEIPDQARDDNAYELIVAHADHGWRADSKTDAEFVHNLAKGYNLPFELAVLKLKGKSEAEARGARYRFLEAVKENYNSKAIIMAHHLDDRIETAVFNLLRGTNIYGLAALRSTPTLVRPLIEVTKTEIINYAKNHKLEWREDSSNNDISYARNRIRRQLIPQLEKKNKNFNQEMIDLIGRAEKLSRSIISLATKLIIYNGKITPNTVELPMEFIRSLQLPVLRHVLVIASRIIKPGAQLKLLTVEQAALHLKTGRIKRLRKLNNQLNLTVQGGKVIITAYE